MLEILFLLKQGKPLRRVMVDFITGGKSTFYGPQCLIRQV